tara:strand:+ start:16917 stop:18332 length:1416 start_codon:yes stop_codon:yes gene_type:complete
MKTLPIKNHLIATLICVAILSCVQDNDFSVPNSLGDEENKNLKTLLDRVDAGHVQLVTIKQLKAQFNSGEEARLITSEIAVKGFVSSSDFTGNFYKEFFIQDAAENATDAIKISLNQVDSYTKFNKGRDLYISLKGLYLGESNSGDGVHAIGGNVKDGEVVALTANAYPSYIFRSENTEIIVPKPVSILTTSAIGIFVTLDNVEFPASSVGQSYVDPSDDYDTQKIVQRCSGFSHYNFALETSTFANFKNEVLTDGNGSISGIVSKTFNGSELVLALNTTADVDLSETRCSLVDIDEFSVVFEDDFETYSNNAAVFGGWTNYKEAGSRAWQIKTTADSQNLDSKTVRISAYSSGDSSNIAWLITPSFDLDAERDAYINFQSSNSFSDNSDLELLISTDWDGTEADVLLASWTALPGIIVSDSTSFEMWIDSSDVDLSAYTGTAYVAFRYTGGGTNHTGIFEIDNFKVYTQN